VAAHPFTVVVACRSAPFFFGIIYDDGSSSGEGGGDVIIFT
jgi:hypothetical protein